MKASIVICTFNEENTIADVLIKCCKLNPDCEIIVADDGSTDNSYCLAKEYPDEKLSVVVITDGEISKEIYNEEIITDLYFALTKNTEKEVKEMYPLAKIINIKSEY